MYIRRPYISGNTSKHLLPQSRFQFSRIPDTSCGLLSNDGFVTASFLTVKSFLKWQVSRSPLVQMNRRKRWWLMCQADAQTAAIIKILVATGSGDGVRVRYVKAVTL